MSTPPLTSTHEEWNTPPDVFAWLNSHFDFTVDAAADFHNALCVKYWDVAQDGLAQDWSLDTVFCNPPYGKKQVDWIKKAAGSWGTSVLLIPARPDTKIWQDVIFPNATAIVFLRGRLKFTLGAKSKNVAPFSSAVVVFGAVPEGFVGSLPARGFGFVRGETARAS